MQKKIIGILAIVAALHAVVLVALLLGDGCTHETPEPPLPADVPGETQPASTLPAAPEEPPMPAPEPAPSALAPKPVANSLPMTTSEPAPGKAEPAKSVTYTVQKGDNLTKIALKYDVRPKDLAAYNNLTDKAARQLKVGQKLKIPPVGTYPAPKSAQPVKSTTSATPAGNVYVVKKGDSLERIARRYGTTARAIAAENNIAVNKPLRIGDKLRLPASAAAAKSAAATSAEPAKLDASIGNDLTPELQPLPPADADGTTL